MGTAPHTLYVQATTGRVHRKAHCAVARRTRYGLYATPAGEVHPNAPRCARCFPTHESQEDTMASTKTDAPKPPARRRRTAAADAPAVTDAALSKGLQEYRNRREAAAANRTKSEAEAVAERATQVKAEQDAAPAKPKRGPSAEQIAAREAKKTADAERVAKVIEMRKAGKKLSEIAAELGYTSQQVVSGVLRRHAPELQTQREAGTGGLTLTPEQVTELQAVEAKFGAKLTTLARALARATA